jgi:hypothetical protein
LDAPEQICTGQPKEFEMANLAPRPLTFEDDPLLRDSDALVQDRRAAVIPQKRYATHNLNAPWFEGHDIAAFVAATIMTLGPLTAYATGFGA